MRIPLELTRVVDQELYDYDIVIKLSDTRILTVAGTYVGADGCRDYEFLAGALPLSMLDGGFGYSAPAVNVHSREDLVYLGSFANTDTLPLPAGTFGPSTRIRMAERKDISVDAIVVGDEGRPIQFSESHEWEFPDLPVAVFV